ncbi:MAG: glycosyltransferase family 2 protein [Phycisphaeraceae bacterium]|nr:glycosyltransferase family 2 protein [Phycisphaeraceae bacterium]
MSPASVTFIIPARNAAATLGDTLQSLLGQTRPDWRAIVIDDGSADATVQVAKALGDPRIEVISQPCSGVAAARNRGLARATSPAVTFLDADDTIEPTFIEHQLPRLSGCDLTAANYRYTGPKLEDARWVVRHNAEDVPKLVEFNQFAIGAIVMDRNSLVRRLGDSPFPSGTMQEDWSVLLRLTAAGARWADPSTAGPLFSYRLTPHSRTTALAQIWRDGMNLIAVHHSPNGKDAALRRWTLRNLARAAAACDTDLCKRLFEHLDSLTPDDVDTLAGGLRWSMRRMMIAAESIARQPREHWHAKIASALGGGAPSLEALRRSAHPDWGTIAAAAAARLSPEQTLVIYGLGRNGCEALAALTGRGLPLAVMDDGPGMPTPLPRLRVDDLTNRHVVLVTPDDRARILRTLSRAGQAQVLLPEQLVA